MYKNHRMNRTYYPIVSGVLSIISGSLSLITALFIIDAIIFDGNSYIWALVPIFSPGYPILFSVFIHVLDVFLGVIGILAITGGIYAFKRKRWNWALTGAICACFFPIVLGIPAIVFVVMSKNEFG